jgi:hypothetical protein
MLKYKEFEDPNDLTFFVNFHHVAKENIQQILVTDKKMHEGTDLEHIEHRLALFYWG